MSIRLYNISTRPHGRHVESSGKMDIGFIPRYHPEGFNSDRWDIHPTSVQHALTNPLIPPRSSCPNTHLPSLSPPSYPHSSISPTHQYPTIGHLNAMMMIISTYAYHHPSIPIYPIIIIPTYAYEPSYMPPYMPPHISARISTRDDAPSRGHDRISLINPRMSP